MILVDSDWIIDALNGQDQANQVLMELASGGLVISAVSYAEVYQGAYYARDPESALRDLRTFLDEKRIFDLTLNVLERFAILRGRLAPDTRRHVGDFDLLIAATAVEHDLILLTRNLKDFRQIPGVRLLEPASDEERTSR